MSKPLFQPDEDGRLEHELRVSNRRAAEDALRRAEVQERTSEGGASPPEAFEPELDEVFLLWASSALYEPGDVQAVYATEASAYAEIARRRDAGDRDDFTVLRYEVKP